tara:strand:- start:419 stop:931 length:513 start_codon:yes stop_codon:yes gene_type:complete
LILFGNVLKKFRSLDQMSWGRLRTVNGLLPAMNQVLLCKLKQKVRAQSDVEIDIALGSLCLRNVQIQSLIKKFDGLLFVLFLSPAQDSFKVGMVRSFLVIFTDFDQELELLFGIFKLVLLDLTVNHTVEGSLVCLVQLGRFLVDLISSIEIIDHAFLKSNLRLEVGVLWI